MKLIRSVLISFILLITTSLISCKYGLQQFMYRDDEANSRSPGVRVLSDSSMVPDIGTDSKFSVIIISDVHFGRSGRNENQRHDDEFFTWLAAKKSELDSSGAPVKFCICLGDCVETGVASEYDEYAQFCAKIKTYGLQVYSIVGNHDLFNSGWGLWKSHCFPYTSSYSFKTAQGDKAMSWYFLDSGNGTLGYNQLSDCIEKLDKDVNPKLIFTHYPIYVGGVFYFTLQNETERDKLLAAFGRDNVKQVFEGHWHAGGSYDFGNKFSETIVKSYIDYRNAGVLTVDLTSQSASIEQFGF